MEDQTIEDIDEAYKTESPSTNDLVDLDRVSESHMHVVGYFNNNKDVIY